MDKVIEDVSNLSFVNNKEGISLVIPTRKRFNGLCELLDTIEKNVKYPENLEVCLYFDEDDVDTIESTKKIIDKYSFQILYCVGAEGEHKKNMCGWNYCYKNICTKNIIALFADDFRVRTYGFDEIVYKTFDRYADKIVCVYGDDLFVSRSLKIATFHFIHRRWIDALPYWLPPYYSVDWVDTHIGDVADIIKRKIYVNELKIEHMHPICGKAIWEEEHFKKIMFEKQTETNKKIYYSEEKMKEREQHAEILKGVIQSR